MAKILYGVCGVGSGHSTRAKAVIDHLIEQGHHVKVIAYGQAAKNLKPFFDLSLIYSPRFYFKKNEIQYLKTLLTNLSKSPKMIKSVYRVSKIIDKFQPQIVFTDFEPTTAIAAKLHNLPLISIDNIHRLTQAKYDVPIKYSLEAMTAKTIIRLIVPHADWYLITSFAEHQPRNKKTFFFPPIIRQDILQTKPTEENYFLVYLSAKNNRLIKLLKKISARFIIYGYNKNEQSGNLQFKTSSYEGFITDLAAAAGVIGTAGFSLISEALCLKKPYLALPIQGQFEQILNAIELEKMDCGKIFEPLEIKTIKDFFADLPRYRRNLENYRRPNNDRLFNKIDELVKINSLD